MGSFSIWHWLIVLAVVLLLFGGRGKISSLMGDFGKGLKAFKKGVGTEENPDGTTTTTTASGEPRVVGSGTTTVSSNTVNEPVIKR
jgi:sec-independent protein translocase protein TatA